VYSQSLNKDVYITIMELIPGFLQGLTRVIISYPFDYVRTNIQAQPNRSIHSYFTQHKLSIKDAYRGSTLQLVSVPMDRSIQFFLFEKYLKKYSVVHSSIISSVVSSLYSVPINFLVTRIINNHTALTKDIFIKFVREKQYYKGFGADLTKSFLGATLYTSAYGSLRTYIPKEHHNYFTFGVISGIASWCIIYPFDTLRVIKQTSTQSYPQIIQTTSFRNLYAGFSIILLRSVPSAGCGMFVYEKSRELLL